LGPIGQAHHLTPGARPAGCSQGGRPFGLRAGASLSRKPSKRGVSLLLDPETPALRLLVRQRFSRAPWATGRKRAARTIGQVGGEPANAWAAGRSRSRVRRRACPPGSAPDKRGKDLGPSRNRRRPFPPPPRRRTSPRRRRWRGHRARLVAHGRSPDGQPCASRARDSARKSVRRIRGRRG
jgi:hypothetical protein